MSEKTSFNIEDAEALLMQTEQFKLCLEQEWSRVLNQWSNLEQTWHDEQYSQFQPLFERLSNTHKNAQSECEEYIILLQRQIDIAKKQRKNLLRDTIISGAENFIAGVQLFNALAAPNVNSPPIPKSTEQLKETVSANYQQEKPNSCVVSDALESENSTEFQVYQSLPGIARAMEAESQLEEAYSQQKEREVEERDEEIKNSMIRDNKLKNSISSPL